MDLMYNFITELLLVFMLMLLLFFVKLKEIKIIYQQDN